MLKKYEVEWKDDFSVTFAVDHSVMTDEKLHEINDFWSGSEDRLDDADGNITKAVLTLLAGVALTIQLEYGLNAFGVMKRFDWDDDGGVEGWPKMDGSDGILLAQISGIEFYESDFWFKEAQLDAMPPAPKPFNG